MKNIHGQRNSEAAVEAALAYNQIRREDAEITFCRLEHDVHGELYHLVFEACLLCYECYVDAETLEVRGVFSEPIDLYADRMAEMTVSDCA